MTKTVTRLMAATAALGLVAAPIMAQASTRAGNSTTVYGTTGAAPGLGRAADGEGQAEGGAGGIILGIAAAGLVIAGVVVASDTENCASPGAC